jgi:hypothetical protein
VINEQLMPSELDALKRLLLLEWDPLGLSDCDGAECHYDPYASRVLEMLAKGAEADAVASYLHSVVTTELSLTGDIACDRAIAAKALAISVNRDRHDAAQIIQK